MIICKYSCHQCSTVKREIQVTPRTEGQELMDWMGLVTLALSFDHNFNSPQCKSLNMNDVMIPLLSNRGIGFEMLPDGSDKYEANGIEGSAG